MEPTAGVEPAPARYEGAVLPATLRRPRSRLEDSNPDSPVIGRTSCRWTKPGSGPVGWGRTSMVPLKRAGAWPFCHDGDEAGCRAGIRTRIFPVNSRTCCRCHHPTSGNGWSGREDSNLHTPAPEAGGLPITLRPDRRWGDRPESNRDQEGHDLPCCPYTAATREGRPSRLAAGSAW